MAKIKIRNYVLAASVVALLAGTYSIAVVVVRPASTVVSGGAVDTDNGVVEAIDDPAGQEYPWKEPIDTASAASLEYETDPLPSVTEQLQEKLPTEAYSTYKAIDPAVARLWPQYQQVAFAAGIPWQILPALQLRETGRSMPEDRSILNGEKLAPQNPDGQGDGPFKLSLLAAANHFKATSKNIGGIEIKPDGNTLAELKRAFLIYSRGYKAQDPDASPYVMNFLDSSRVNMVWPAGDPVTQIFGNGHRDGNPGALTTYIRYDGPVVE